MATQAKHFWVRCANDGLKRRLRHRILLHLIRMYGFSGVTHDQISAAYLTDGIDDNICILEAMYAVGDMEASIYAPNVRLGQAQSGRQHGTPHRPCAAWWCLRY